MKIAEQQAICTRPFEWFEIHPDGSVFLCCPAWLKRPIGNLLQQGVEEIWNGPVALEIRKSILNGSFHNCNKKRCPHLINGSSPVQPANRLADTELISLLKHKNGHLPLRPRKLNLCFDYSCTLACPSCRSNILQAQGQDLLQAEQLRHIIEQELLPYTRTLTLSGFGDPFGSPTYLQLLRKLNQQAYPRLEQVRLHTNGQLLTAEMWQSLPGLQPLVSEIEVSIDAATEQTYQQNRPGGSFTKLLQNLEFISRQPCKLTLSMVVQQNNWREIPLLLQLSEQLGAQHYLSILVNWGTFEADEYRQRAVHLALHPEHAEFVKLLQTLTNKDLNIGNLALLAGRINTTAE